MRRNLVCVLGALAIAVVAFAPTKAAAGWGWWGGPRFGFGITIGPRTDIGGDIPMPRTAITATGRTATMATARTAITPTLRTGTTTIGHTGTRGATRIGDGASLSDGSCAGCAELESRMLR